MTFAPLADAANLPASWTDNTKRAKAVAIASSAIRDAAGVPITRETATVVLDGDGSPLLRLPGPIVRDSVTGVTVDGTAPSAYRVVAEGLWRSEGWSNCLGEPVPVQVTFTFGLPEVPEDIADLCLQLAITWLEHDAAGGGGVSGVQSARIDDGMEAYTAERSGAVSPVYVPEATARWLRSRFNAAGATVVGHY